MKASKAIQQFVAAAVVEKVTRFCTKTVESSRICSKTGQFVEKTAKAEENQMEKEQILAMEEDLKRKSDLLAEVKTLLRQAAAR